MFGQPYPPSEARKEIVFVRHAESQANLDGIWNGRTDGDLSPAGGASLEALGQRLARWDFDAVFSSPLKRAIKTAEAFADEVIVDDDFTEIDLGRWEGMAFTDVQSLHGDKLEQAIRTRTLAMGETGESLAQAAERALGAVDRLFERMGENERVAVVTHGGFLQPVLSRHLAGGGRRVHAFTSNTGITRIIHQYGRPRLASFNDTGHFGPFVPLVEAHVKAGDPVLALIRHGRTRANVERRWQGRGDWDLDEVGKRQAELLGKWYGRHPTVYSSPLRRAQSTAEQVASNGVIPIDDLMEMHMGDWEGLTTEEISDHWPQDVETIYLKGEDLPRGGTGETWSQLTIRVAGAISELQHSPDGITVVVAHGGAIRSYVSSLTETGDTHSESLYTPPNTSVTHIAMTERGPEILEFAVAAHLESDQ